MTLSEEILVDCCYFRRHDKSQRRMSGIQSTGRLSIAIASASGRISKHAQVLINLHTDHISELTQSFERKKWFYNGIIKPCNTKQNFEIHPVSKPA